MLRTPISSLNSNVDTALSKVEFRPCIVNVETLPFFDRREIFGSDDSDDDVNDSVLSRDRDSLSKELLQDNYTSSTPERFMAMLKARPTSELERRAMGYFLSKEASHADVTAATQPSSNQSLVISVLPVRRWVTTQRKKEIVVKPRTRKMKAPRKVKLLQKRSVAPLATGINDHHSNVADAEFCGGSSSIANDNIISSCDFAHHPKEQTSSKPFGTHHHGEEPSAENSSKPPHSKSAMPSAILLPEIFD